METYRPLNSHLFTVCHTTSLPFSWSHSSFFISHGFTNFERIFSQTLNSLRKETLAAHSKAAEECISSMINKNKTSFRSSLSLRWALFHCEDTVKTLEKTPDLPSLTVLSPKAVLFLRSSSNSLDSNATRVIDGL